MKKRIPMGRVLLGLALALGAMGLAADQTSVTPQKPPNPSPAPALSADLQIKWIAAAPCGCEADMAAVDAILLEGPITVRVFNAGPRAADADVTVDAMLHRHGAASSHQSVHLEKGQSLNVVFQPNRSSQNPLLICRSLGIKAVVKLTTPNVFDPNAANNTLTIHGCQPIVE